VLGDADIRLSPRRARLMTRTLLAARIIAGELDEEAVHALLAFSLPHKAWGDEPAAPQVAAAHRMAWDTAYSTGNRRWVHDFHLESSLANKARMLLDSCPGPDVGSLAVEQLLAHESKERAAAFALAAFPAATSGRLPLGAEGINDLGRIASEMLEVWGHIKWQERSNGPVTQHPELSRVAPVLVCLEGARHERAVQLLYWCLVNEVVLKDPADLEEQFDQCVRVFAEEGAA